MRLLQVPHRRVPQLALRPPSRASCGVVLGALLAGAGLPQSWSAGGAGDKIGELEYHPARSVVPSDCDLPLSSSTTHIAAPAAASTVIPIEVAQALPDVALT